MEYFLNILQSAQAGVILAVLCIALLLANTLSLLSSVYWFFDLFVNFKIQYFAGSTLLFLLCLANGNTTLAVVMAIVAATILIEIQAAYTKEDVATEPANFKLIQYNKFYFNGAHARIDQWLRTQQPDADILLVNESLPKDIERFKELQDFFPYQYPESSNQKFHNISVLSKHPINVDRFSPEDLQETRQALKISLNKIGIGNVIVYAYHAPVPAGATYSRKRNESLKSIAEIIGKEAAANVLLAGDWNMTAFSPHFKKIVTRSGLKNMKTGFFPPTTWPSFNQFSFLKIPIDHVLCSPAIKPVDIHKGPSLGSDHHPLVARFHVNSEE